MHKDFKIGLCIGLLLVTAAAIWLGTSPKLSTESRALQNASSHSAPPAIIPQSPADEAKPQPPEQPPQEKPAPRIHIVEKGQTLSQISQQYYGTSRQWQKILNANRDVLPDPNRLTTGLKLIIPE
jgi:nucleoid-associated protein YgaU